MDTQQGDKSLMEETCEVTGHAYGEAKEAAISAGGAIKDTAVSAKEQAEKIINDMPANIEHVKEELKDEFGQMKEEGAEVVDSATKSFEKGQSKA